MEPAGGSVDDGSMDLYCYLAPQNSQIHTQMFCNRKLPSFQWQNMPVDFGACKIIRKGLFSKNMGQLNPGRQIEPADRYDGSVLVRQRRKQRLLLVLTSSVSAAPRIHLEATSSALEVVCIPVSP